MHWELWALNTGNLVGDFETEAEALTIARELVMKGWSADDLGLRPEWDYGEEGDDAFLPPALYGTALIERL
jgi:hypothetical protein